MARHRAISGLMLLTPLLVWGASAGWADERGSRLSMSSIGLFTAIQGNVFTARAGLLHPLAAGLHQAVFVRDVIETQPRSRAKALLQDDTLLTIGDDSRVEITAFSHKTEQDQRRLVIRLVRGQARVLVGRAFGGTGSIVELQTPTALVASREGYFVVDINAADKGGGMAEMLSAKTGTEGVTTVLNLGGAGTVNFRSGGSSVVLDPGQRSMAQPRGTPTQPALVLIAADRSNAAIAKMLQVTDLKDQLLPEAARQSLLANGGEAVSPSASKPKPGPQGPQEPAVGSSASQALLVTPPAVISGAASVDHGAATSVTQQGSGGGTTSVVSPATPTVTPPSSPQSIPIPTLPPINSGGPGKIGKKGGD